MNTTITYSQPSVPSLYFETHQCNSNSNSTSEHNNNDDNSIITTTTLPHLPSELLSQCFAKYSNWGDLAKLAQVQKSWSTIVTDTANQSIEAQWELANAFLNGDCGLEQSPQRAVRVLQQLLAQHIQINESTGKPIFVMINNDKERDDGDEDDDTNQEDATIYSLAMKKIAECYLNGVGVARQNTEVALAWMEAAYYTTRDAAVALELGIIHEQGQHEVDVDVVAAAVWFERGAVQGNVDAMFELGLCYELGAGVDCNDEHALDWYTQAAKLGHVTAAFSVGEIFEEGRGVPQSDAEACLWYYDAANTDAGCPDSKLALRRLYDIARIVVPGVKSILEV